jgi:hypothetical protein
LDDVEVSSFKDPLTDYQISDIAVGTGLSKSRPFDGAVSNFTMEYTLFDRNRLIVRMILLGKMIGLCGVVAFLSLMIIQYTKISRDPAFQTATFRIRLFYVTLFIGFALQTIYYVANYYKGLSYPFTSPLFIPYDRFMDFFNINSTSIADNRYTKLHALYPPFMLLIARYFSLFADYTYGPFLARDQYGGLISAGLLIAIFIFILFLVARQLTVPLANEPRSDRWRDSLLFFLSIIVCYPVLFAVDRLNYIVMSFIFLYFFVYSKDQNSRTSTLALAAAISMKPHFIFYLIALSDRENIKKLYDTLLWIIFLNLMACIILWDFHYIVTFFDNYRYFSKSFIQTQKIFASPSIFSTIMISLNILSNPKLFVMVERVYTVASMVLIIMSSIYIKNKIRDINFRMFYLTILLILLPVASYDYNLILLILYVPYLLTRIGKEFSTLEIFLLAIILIPKNYLTLMLEPCLTQFGSTYLRYTEQIIVTPLILLAMVISMLFKYRKKIDNDGVQKSIFVNQP